MYLEKLPHPQTLTPTTHTLTSVLSQISVSYFSLPIPTIILTHPFRSFYLPMCITKMSTSCEMLRDMLLFCVDKYNCKCGFSFHNVKQSVRTYYKCRQNGNHYVEHLHPSNVHNEKAFPFIIAKSVFRFVFILFDYHNGNIQHLYIPSK